MMTDPIADMLTRLRNGVKARHIEVTCRWSKLKEQLARVLTQQGYIAGFSKRTVRKGVEQLVLQPYDNTPAQPRGFRNLQRVSRPGLRRYFNARSLPVVRRGLGTMLLSTSQGVLTLAQARKVGIGGEPICVVW